MNYNNKKILKISIIVFLFMFIVGVVNFSSELIKGNILFWGIVLGFSVGFAGLTYAGSIITQHKQMKQNNEISIPENEKKESRKDKNSHEQKKIILYSIIISAIIILIFGLLPEIFSWSSDFSNLWYIFSIIWFFLLIFGIYNAFMGYKKRTT